MPLGIRDQESSGKKLPDDREPPTRVKFGSNSKGLKLIVPELPDPIGRFAQEDIDKMMGAKPLTGAIDCRQHLLCCDSPIVGLGLRVSAVVAVARSEERRVGKECR